MPSKTKTYSKLDAFRCLQFSVVQQIEVNSNLNFSRYILNIITEITIFLASGERQKM